MLRVWHAREFGFYSAVVFPRDYTAVAEVDTFDPEVAFQLTNHVDRPWWEYNGVTRLGPETRSTSVGDVIEDAAGKGLLLVRPFGHVPIEHGAEITWEGVVQ